MDGRGAANSTSGTRQQNSRSTEVNSSANAPSSRLPPNLATRDDVEQTLLIRCRPIPSQNPFTRFAGVQNQQHLNVALYHDRPLARKRCLSRPCLAGDRSSHHHAPQDADDAPHDHRSAAPSRSRGASISRASVVGQHVEKLFASPSLHGVPSFHGRDYLRHTVGPMRSPAHAQAPRQDSPRPAPLPFPLQCPFHPPL